CLIGGRQSLSELDHQSHRRPSGHEVTANGFGRWIAYSRLSPAATFFDDIETALRGPNRDDHFQEPVAHFGRASCSCEHLAPAPQVAPRRSLRAIHLARCSFRSNEQFALSTCSKIGATLVAAPKPDFPKCGLRQRVCSPHTLEQCRSLEAIRYVAA